MTQCDAILDYIKTHGEITPIDALNELGCMRLASRINDLRRRGEPVVSERRERTNAKGEVKRFAVYKLE